MNHIYDKFVIALDHSTLKCKIYFKKEKTTNQDEGTKKKTAAEEEKKT